MIGSPFRYEADFTDDDYQALGRLMMRWSHTEHIIGNCLKVIMRLTDDEAVVAVFPAQTHQRIKLIKQFSDLNPLPVDARKALDEFMWAWQKLQQVRNMVAHGIVDNTSGTISFHLRSKGKTWSKADVLVCEELTNFAAHAALSFRYALGFKGQPGERHPLPSRPLLPPFLESM